MDIPVAIRCFFVSALTSAAVAISSSANAQLSVPSGVDQAPTRVLQVEEVLGSVSVQRSGRAEELRHGFLVFNDDRVMLGSRSHADLLLARYGELDLVSSGEGPGALSLEKLPFSTWAVDLDTRLRLERGVLRVRWARSGNAEDWPFSILLDHWSAQLGNGEFLFRRDEAGLLACTVSGSLELTNGQAGKRETLKPGRCFGVKPGENPSLTVLTGADWSELRVAFLPNDSEDVAASRQITKPVTSASAPSDRIVSPPPSMPGPETTTIIAETSSQVLPLESSPAPAATRPLPEPTTIPELSMDLPQIPPQPLVAEAKAPPIVTPSFATEPDTKREPDVHEPAAPAQMSAAEAKPSAPPADAEHKTPESATLPVSMRPLAEAEVPAVPSRPAVGGTTVATAPPAAMPVNTAPSTSSNGPEWIVNVMTVTDPDVAKQHLQTLTAAGYPASLRTEQVRGRASYRVVIGGISNEQGARRTAQLLARQMGYNAAWPLQKR